MFGRYVSPGLEEFDCTTGGRPVDLCTGRVILDPRTPKQIVRDSRIEQRKERTVTVGQERSSAVFPHGESAETVIVGQMQTDGLIPATAGELREHGDYSAGYSEELEELDLSDFNFADTMESLEPLDSTGLPAEVAEQIRGRSGTNVGTGSLCFDIETGPRPWNEIEQFFEPPQPPGEFDESAVKYGNAKKPETRAPILAKAKEDHAAAVAAYPATVEAAKAEFIDRAALSPITGRVLAVGLRRLGGPPIIIGHDNEAALLANWWQIAASVIESGEQIVGFNSNGFDLPFLVRRSWMLGVDIPAGMMDGRPFHRSFVDLMQVWGCGAREFVKLDVLAAVFGVTRKSGSGAEYAKLWAEDREAALEYLATDLLVTCELARKMRVC